MLVVLIYSPSGRIGGGEANDIKFLVEKCAGLFLLGLELKLQALNLELSSSPLHEVFFRSFSATSTGSERCILDVMPN